MADFLVYWLPWMADAELAEGEPLRQWGSTQARRAQVGDTFWFVTARSGRLSLLGRLRIGRMTDPLGAQRALRTADLWPGPFQALAAPGTAEPMRELRLTFGEVASLRFERAARDRLDLADGRVYPQQLQTMRRLTPGAAARLARRWSRPARPGQALAGGPR